MEIIHGEDATGIMYRAYVIGNRWTAEVSNGDKTVGHSWHSSNISEISMVENARVAFMVLNSIAENMPAPKK